MLKTERIPTTLATTDAPTYPVPQHRRADLLGERLTRVGGGLLRYGLVAILLYIGALKFTAAEADAIQPLVANSPFMGWLYGVLSVQAVSSLIGVSELVIAGLIAARPVAPRLSGVGSLVAIGMFLSTLSFLVTTPGVWETVPGFPIPAPTLLGQFLAKDVFLLGAAVWSAGEALAATRRP